jgi:flagellar biosynthesis protein FlhG
MHDQANDLRNLVRHCVPPPALPGARRPGLIAVAGGKGGVGTTTLAVHLAMALDRRQLRTVLIDAAAGGDAATLCGVEPRDTVADVLAGRRTVTEAIQSGPGTLGILPGLWGAAATTEMTPLAIDRLFAQVAALGDSTDMVVYDAGNSPSRLADRCWQVADLLLLTMTAETPAVMESYAAIKRLAARARTAPIHVVVNMTTNEQAADEAYGRLAGACRRFLAVELTPAAPFPWQRRATQRAASRPMDRLLDTLLSAVDHGKQSRLEAKELQDVA